MMKKYGYRPSMAGAIEATASSAGQIMPPVLGLASFMIASFLNKPYIDFALSALIPALLYLAGVGIGILVYARLSRLPRLDKYADRRMILQFLPPFLVSFSPGLFSLVNHPTPPSPPLH